MLGITLFYAEGLNKLFHTKNNMSWRREEGEVDHVFSKPTRYAIAHFNDIATFRYINVEAFSNQA